MGSVDARDTLSSSPSPDVYKYGCDILYKDIKTVVKAVMLLYHLRHSAPLGPSYQQLSESVDDILLQQCVKAFSHNATRAPLSSENSYLITFLQIKPENGTQ